MKILTNFIEIVRRKIAGEKKYRLVTYPSQPRERDPLLGETVRQIINDDSVSPGSIQRKMRVGYARAVRLMEDLEHAGIIPPQVVSARTIFKTNANEYLKDPKMYDQSRNEDVDKYLNHKT